MGTTEPCVKCNRVDCPTFTMPVCIGTIPNPGCPICHKIDKAKADCEAHAVDWRRRALEAEARERWVSVEERLPEVGVDVLVTNGADMHIANMDVLYDGSVWWADCSGGPARNDTIHWRSLPAAPEVP